MSFPVGLRSTVGDFTSALDAARAGKPVGFDWLFRLVADPLVGYFRAQRAWDPDGLANEVLVRVFTQLDRFHGDESGFRAWVFSIASCRIIDERRASARRPRCSELDSNVVKLFGGDAEHDVLTKLGTEWVQEILESLEPAQREVLVLRFVADLSLQEAADALDKSVGAVKALQRRGLAAVRRTLDGEIADFSRVAVSQ
jgi:RNA polymerase sigma-70 factor (ECF subfamily)